MTPGPVPNTLGVDCVADDVCVVTSAEQLAERLGRADADGVPATIVGAGSNIVPRARLVGLALLPRLRGMRFERLSSVRWRVVAAAGETWQALVRATLGRGISGLENLALIPGSVGAAPLQNIGAYGRELADVVESVTVFDRSRGDHAVLPAEACGFRYRDSRFKSEDAGRYVVESVSLLLGGRAPVAHYPDVALELERMGAGASAVGVAEAVARVRRRKLPDPRRIPNVGSFFKNPLLSRGELDGLRSRIRIDAQPADGAGRVKVSAARLIDAAGWKGARRGLVQVWPRQPLVLVNLGGASGRDVLALGEAVRTDVEAKFGVRLQLEPAVLGVDRRC